MSKRSRLLLAVLGVILIAILVPAQVSVQAQSPTTPCSPPTAQIAVGHGQLED